MPTVCFVCLGNICRSPMAQAVLEHLLAERQLNTAWSVDSAGTGSWHVGKSPDPRTLAVLTRNGITTRQRARQVSIDDFHRFDWLLAMDDDNLANLQAMQPSDARAALHLLGDFDPDGRSEVPDPYYGGPQGFDLVYAMVTRCCSAFLDQATAEG